MNPISEIDKQRFMNINDDNLNYLRSRYNKVNRWVIADLIRRSAYRYPDKPALLFRDLTMTYAQLEEECNRFAQALLDHGLKNMTG